MCGTAYPVAKYVQMWRKGELPADPPPDNLDARPSPWFDLRPPVDDLLAAPRHAMTAELQRELRPGHQLQGLRVEPLAKHGHCDSVAFRLPADHYAIVHLTWAHRPELPPLPSAQTFSGWPATTAAMATHSS